MGRKSLIMAFNARRTKRLQREIGTLLSSTGQEDNCGICVEIPDEGNMMHIKAYLQGPPDTPYESGLFLLDVNFPTDYPLMHQRSISQHGFGILIFPQSLALSVWIPYQQNGHRRYPYTHVYCLSDPSWQHPKQTTHKTQWSLTSTSMILQTSWLRPDTGPTNLPQKTRIIVNLENRHHLRRASCSVANYRTRQ